MLYVTFVTKRHHFSLGRGRMSRIFASILRLFLWLAERRMIFLVAV